VEFIPSPPVAYQDTSSSIPSIPSESAADKAHSPRARHLYVGSSHLNSLPSDISANAEPRGEGIDHYRKSAETHNIPSDTMAFNTMIPQTFDGAVVATLTSLCESLKSMNGTNEEIIAT